MRPAEPRLYTTQAGAGWVVGASYESPEGQRLIGSLRTITFGLALAVYAALWLTLLNDWLRSFSDGERMVMMMASVVAAGGMARVTSDFLADARFWLRSLLDRKFEIAMCREAVTSGGKNYPRDRKIAFTSEPHRQSRREERAERVSGEIIPETYRAAHEVRLQHGETLIVIAEVSDQQAANAIVRRLQVIDELATRGNGTKGAGFGSRQSPE